MELSWASNVRRKELPPGWVSVIRPRILRRDRYTCQQCGAPANQVDHIRRGNDHSDSNLQALCEKCHRRKTAREGKEARYGLAPRRGKRFEPHPGMKEG